MAKKELKEGKIYCAKCNLEMREVLLPKYEYAEGLPLHNVSAYRCHKCGNTFFTEQQAKEMESRTNELKDYAFGFERKVTISGKSLAVTIPHELADHLNIEQGQKVTVFPVAKEGFMVKLQLNFRR